MTEAFPAGSRMQVRCLGPYFLAVLLFAVSFGLQACGDSPESRGLQDTASDIAEAFVPADPGTQRNFQKHLQVMRRGERKDALVLVAPAVLRAPLQGASGRRTLKCWAAPVFDIGDGIQMNLYLRRAGVRIPTGSRYFDPGRKAEDRSWIPISIPLDISAGDQLEIEVSAGPQGDLVADWLALSGLQLVAVGKVKDKE